MEEPITDRNFSDIVLQGLTKEYWDVKRMVCKDPDFDRPNIQSVLQCVTSTWTGSRGTNREGLLDMTRP